MATTNLQSLCQLPVSGLYAYQADGSSSGLVYQANGSSGSASFVLCSDLGSACLDRSCDCRNSSVTTNGYNTVYIAVCVDDNDPCTGPQYVNCSNSNSNSSSESTSAGTMTPAASSIAPSAGSDPVGATSAPSSSIIGSSSALGSRQSSKSSPSSGSDNPSRSTPLTSSPSFESNDQSSAASSSSAPTGSNSIANTDSGSTSPLSIIAKASAITIGVAGLLLSAILLVRIVRRRRAADREKVSSNETVFSAPSPTNSTRSSVAPSSFPAFEHHARGISSPLTGHRPDPSRTAQNLNYYRKGPVLDSEPRYPAAHQQDLARTCDIAHRLDRRADQISHYSSTIARSSASTVEIPGRRRPPSLRAEVKQQPASAAPTERIYRSRISPDNNTDLYSTEAPSEVDWTPASALSDESYFHQSLGTASVSSEGLRDDYSWRQQSRGFDRDTDTSIRSFFSDATDEDSIYRDLDVEL